MLTAVREYIFVFRRIFGNLRAGKIMFFDGLLIRYNILVVNVGRYLVVLAEIGFTEWPESKKDEDSNSYHFAE